MARVWCVRHGSGRCVHRCERLVCHAHGCTVRVRCVCHPTAVSHVRVVTGCAHKHGAVPAAECRVPRVPVPCPHRRCRSPRPPRCGSLRARAHLRTRGAPPAHEPPPPSPPSLSPPPGPGATPEPPAAPPHAGPHVPGAGGSGCSSPIPGPVPPRSCSGPPRLEPGVEGAGDSWRGPGDSRGAPGLSPGGAQPAAVAARGRCGRHCPPRGAGSSCGMRGWGHPEPPRQLQRGAGEARWWREADGAGQAPRGGQ